MIALSRQRQRQAMPVPETRDLEVAAEVVGAAEPKASTEHQVPCQFLA